MFWIVLLFGTMAVVIKLLSLGVNVLLVVWGSTGAVYLVRRLRRS